MCCRKTSLLGCEGQLVGGAPVPLHPLLSLPPYQKRGTPLPHPAPLEGEPLPAVRIAPGFQTQAGGDTVVQVLPPHLAEALLRRGPPALANPTLADSNMPSHLGPFGGFWAADAHLNNQRRPSILATPAPAYCRMLNSSGCVAGSPIPY